MYIEKQDIYYSVNQYCITANKEIRSVGGILHKRLYLCSSPSAEHSAPTATEYTAESLIIICHVSANYKLMHKLSHARTVK